MKRIGASMGLSALVTLSLAYYLGNTFVYVAFIVLFFIAILSKIIKKYRDKGAIRIVCISAMISLLIFTCYTEYVYKPTVYNYSGKELYITATVREAPYRSYGNYYYYIKTTEIDGKAAKTGILLKSKYNLNAELDDTISFRGIVSPNSNDTYKSKGYYLYAVPYGTGKIAVTPAENHTIMYYPYLLRERFEEIISDNMEEDSASICNAVAFGDKANIDTSIKEIFRRAGLSHILVVSGLHLSVLSYIFLLIFRKLLRRRYFYCPVTILFVLFYMVMTGLSPSIMRSGIMMIIVILGEMLWKEADSLNSLGIAALVIVSTNPYSAGDIGMLLSFSATLGIILFSGPLNRYVLKRIKFSDGIISRIVKRIISIVCITVSAVIPTIPLSIIFFKHVSLMQVFSNLLIEPVFKLLLIVIFIAALLGFTKISFIYLPFIFIADILTKYIYFVAKLMSLVPMGYVSTDKPFVYIWLVITFILVIAIILIKNYKISICFSAIISFLVLISGMLGNYIYDYNNPKLTVYDTGIGICATLSSKGQSAVLSCGGNNIKRDIAEDLENDAYEYTVMGITDETNSRCMYAQDIISKFDLKKIFIYDDSVICRQDNVIYFDNDYTVRLKDMDITYIVRDNKVFTYVKCRGNEILILPKNGDCKNLDSKYRNPDIVLTDSPCKNSSYISAKLLIICCSEEYYDRIIRSNYIKADKIYTTFNGDVEQRLEVQ